MSRIAIPAARVIGSFGAFILLGTLFPSLVGAQAIHERPVQFQIEEANQRMEMIVNSSRILTLDKKIPKAMVANPDLVRLRPISANQLQLSARKPGVTEINIWDEDEKVYTVDLVIYGDARELQMLLDDEFPNASLRVKPLANSGSVLISGYVDRPEVVTRVISLAEDYYSTVRTNIRVGGVQQVQLHVKVMEVSRTKLRTMGFDWVDINGNDIIVQSVSGLIGEITQDAQTGLIEIERTGADTMRFGIIDGHNAFFGFVEALRRNRLAKVLAEPTVTTVSGRAASFNSGGEFAYDVSQGLGAVETSFREFGTRIDFVPIVLGNGRIRLEVRPYITEIDFSLASETGIPGLRSRWVDTAVEMKAGQTLALAGLLQTRVESENRGIPILADLPWAGALFRRTEESVNEVELLILVRPELAAAMDPGEVPPCGPGEFTTSPSDVDLYFRGYTEVPKCCNGGQCGHCESCRGGATMGPSPMGTQIIEGPTTTLPASDPRAVAPPRDSTAGVQPQFKLTDRGLAPVGDRAGGTAAVPIAAPQNPTSRRIRNERPQSHPSAGPAPTENAPGIVGPIGYDDLDY